MKEFFKEMQVRWSDLDPNFHLRHSVYYDWGAFCRIDFFNNHGLTADVMTSHHFGPILFREECIFKKEIKLNDEIIMDLKIIRAKQDFSRWSIQHNILRKEKTLCAVLTVDGAWIDTAKRKLATPPSSMAHIFDLMPKSENFEWQT